ncbi:MAG: fluoride efflux transporter CrcB [Leptospiraceae bacterium]|nr:fluoride efflux transporter CrcB [Leptospiraceae bacterium]MCP5500775.1 fluoride efflux transporter CrcB [Leptospiraceae bacterium]
MEYLYISLGAALGGSLRYAISIRLNEKFWDGFPLGTLSVNVLGSFFLGFILYYLTEKQNLSSEMKLFLGTGFCGGFTTFSTFSVEVLKLFKTSGFFPAFLYILLSLSLSLFFVFLAYSISPGFFRS